MVLRQNGLKSSGMSSISDKPSEKIDISPDHIIRIKSPASSDSCGHDKLDLPIVAPNQGTIGRPASPISSKSNGNNLEKKDVLKGKAKLSVLQPSTETGSTSSVNSTADSFPWLEQDELEMIEDEEEFLDITEQLDEQASVKPPSLMQLIPNWLFNYLAFGTFSSLLVLGQLGIIGMPMYRIFYVPLHAWALLLWQILFLPYFVNNFLQVLSERSKLSVFFTYYEVPLYLETIRRPLSMLICTISIALVWLTQAPLSCGTQPGAFNLFSHVTTGLQKLDSGDVSNPFDICYLNYAPKVFFCLFLTGLVFTIECLIMRFFRASFLERTFQSRMLENQFKVYIVEQLKKASDSSVANRKRRKQVQVNESIKSSQSSHVSEYEPEREGEFLIALPFTIPFTIPQSLSNLFRRKPYIRIQTDKDLSVPPAASSPRDYHQYCRTFFKSVRAIGLDTAQEEFSKYTSDLESKVLARDIFRHLCPMSLRKHMILDDFKPIFQTDSASSDAYFIFDRDRDGSITRKEFRTTMVSIFKEQRNVHNSIKDAAQALSKLHTIILTGLSIIVLFLSLAVFNIQVQSLLTLGLSIILGLNFIIGEAAKNTFISLVFLFVQHPYDVGDRVTVGSISNVELLTVKQINLLNTIFKRWNGHEIYMANHNLSNNTIVNISRSTEQWERIDFEIYAPSRDTTKAGGEEDQLGKFRDALESFLRVHAADYYTQFDLRAIVAADVGRNETSLDTLCFTLRIQCKATVDSQKRWNRHARLIAFVKRTVHELGMSFAEEHKS